MLYRFVKEDPILKAAQHFEEIFPAVERSFSRNNYRFEKVYINQALAEPVNLKYSLTEEDNISGVTKTKKLLQEGNKIPYPEVDSTLIVEKDKTHTRGSALTIGRNIDDSSSLFFNLGLDINTIVKKRKGDSDVISSSLSYFKVLGDHYISPYVYWNKPNYRRQEDYQTLGVGINNTFILNEKNNFNYSIGYSDTHYEDNPTFDEANENNNRSRQIEIIGWFFDKPDRS